MKSLTEIFENLINSKVNYHEGTRGIGQQYFKISNDIHINDYLDYNKTNELQYAINVAIPNISDTFIPFFHIQLDSQERSERARKRFLEIREHHLIKYNFSDFIDESTANDVKIRICRTEENTPIVDFLTDREIDGKLADKLLKKLHRKDSFTISMWEDKDLFDKPDELYIEIRKFDYSFEGKYLSSIVVSAPSQSTIDEFFKTKLGAVQIITELIKSKYAFDINSIIKYEANKSAKAAIMSRNMSHNLGSHVMYYIKQQLNSVSKITEGDVLNDLYPRDTDVLINVLTQSQDFEMPFLVGLGKFINYLQERQDYIATIATDYIPANSTISFKDFIYDELKPDLRYTRHKGRGSSETETKGHQPKNLLMDYIAYSEGYTSSENILLRFRNFTGANPELNPDKTIKKGTREAISFENMRKLNIAVPGGVIGRQALFSILENVIRNAAKHSKKRPDRKTLSIDFDYVEKCELNITNYDEIDMSQPLPWWKGLRAGGVHRDMDDIELQKLYAEYAEKYIIFTITNNMPNTSDSFKGLIDNGLNRQYVDDNGKMDEASKGVKEIRISAAWLRGYNIDTDIPANEPPAIAVRRIPLDLDFKSQNTELLEGDNHTNVYRFSKKQWKDTQNKDCAIQYVICLPKPREIAFIGEISNENILKIANSDGCRQYIPRNGEFFDDNTLILKNESHVLKEISDYDLVVICDDRINLERIRPRVNSRIIEYKEIENATSIESKSDLYRAWYEYQFKESSTLSILDEKSTLTHSSAAEKLGVNCQKASENDEKYYNECIVFSTHYNSQADENESEDRRERFAKAKFVEGITGNNSTDRLIRQDEWTELWKYKHLAAGLTKVAIIDERISSSMAPSQSQSAELTNQILEKFDLSEKHSRMDLEKILNDKLDKKFNNKKLIISDILSLAKPYVKENYNSESRNELEKTIKYRLSKNSIAQQYHEKRIWAYNIITDNSAKEVHFIGYKAPILNTIGKYSEEIGFGTLATIRCVADGKYEVVKNEIQNKFDFISIHQGILDKIYNTFEVKNNDEEKKKITYELFKAFSTQYEQPESQDGAQLTDVPDYIPHFIIHSGRSKPSKFDMPQRLPFIQFAAIDHAVRDCKYTLSELLYSAHYE